MKRKGTKAVYILFFIAAVFFAAFVLAEFRSDYLSVGLAGIVMLIAAYFLVDKIERDIYEKYELDKQDINNKFDETSEQIQRGYDRMEQLQEAILTAATQGLSNPNETFSKLLNELDEVGKKIEEREAAAAKISDEQMSRQMQQLSHQQKETIQLLKNGFKAIIQYSKENARQVALHSSENTDQLLARLSEEITALKEELPMLVRSNSEEIESKFDHLSDAYLENTTSVSQRLNEIEKLTNQIQKVIEEGDVA